MLCKEYGLFILYVYLMLYLDEMSNLLLKIDDKRKYIDIIEFVFNYIDIYFWIYEVMFGLELDKVISELNNIFYEYGLKY